MAESLEPFAMRGNHLTAEKIAVKTDPAPTSRGALGATLAFRRDRPPAGAHARRVPLTRGR